VLLNYARLFLGCFGIPLLKDAPNRIKLGLCELCNKKTHNIALHQVKRLKDLKGKEEWERVMLERRRKTLAVCPECHDKIHK
jgi:transposase